MPKLEAILCRARQILDDKSCWCKGRLSNVATSGGLAAVMDPNAKSFCAIGACWRACGEYYGVTAVEELTTHTYKRLWHWITDIVNPVLSQCVPSNTSQGRSINIVIYNDLNSTTHEDIKAVFDRAIATVVQDSHDSHRQRYQL